MRTVVLLIYAERKSIKRTNNKAVTPIIEAQIYGYSISVIPL